jgi:hypothetical protein
LVESLFKRFLPRGAWYEMPFVEKRTQPLLIYESRRDGFDQWLIAALMAQKNVIALL